MKGGDLSGTQHPRHPVTLSLSPCRGEDPKLTLRIGKGRKGRKERKERKENKGRKERKEKEIKEEKGMRRKERKEKEGK